MTTPYVTRTKPFTVPSNRVPTSNEAGPSNPNRNQLHAASGSRQNQAHEAHDVDDEVDIQEVEARTIPRGTNNNGKRKAVGNEDDDDEIQEVDPPRRLTRSRGGSRKPSSTVNGKPASSSNGAAAKGKGGQQKEDGPVARLEEELRQVRLIGNYRTLLVVLIEYSKLMSNLSFSFSSFFIGIISH